MLHPARRLIPLFCLLCTIAAEIMFAGTEAFGAGALTRRPLPSVIDARLTAAAEALTRGVDPLTLRAPVGAVALAAPDHPPGLPGRQAPTHLPGARRPLPGGALRPFVRPDGRLQVQVRVEPGGEVAAVAKALRAQGVEVQRLRPAEGLLQALVAPERLDRLGRDPRIAAVRPPDYAFPQVGSVLTQGDAAISADLARAGLGAGGYSARLGRRIRIGVVSDGVAGLGRSQLSGDLPVELTARSFIDTGSLVQDSGCAVIAEGRALLEIVHDLVPDAELFFAAVETDLDYIAAVEWLRARVDVIVDDIAFFNAGPYDGTSAVARVRTETVAAGVTYVAAVGNSGDGHHRSSFNADSNTSTPRFSQVAHRFPNGTFRLPVDVAARGQAIVFLQWSNTPFTAASTDFDLIAFDSASGGRVVDESTGLQAGRVGDRPTEAVFLDNSRSGTDRTFGLQIEFCGPVTDGFCDPTSVSPPSTVFEIFVIGSATIPGPSGVNLVRDGSIPNGPDAADIITVGAFCITAGPFCKADGELERFSSFGPVVFGPDDVKPTLIGPDGVKTTVDNVPGLGGRGRFFGTSAATPHVGAVAAMILALEPGLTPADVRSRLTATASPVGAPVPNNEAGYGRVDAATAVTGLVSTDEGFTLAPGSPPLEDGPASPTAAGVPIVSFVLSRNASAVTAVTVVGIAATARLGLESGDPGTTGHERADLKRVCVLDAEAPTVPLGCSTFAADDGRLLVLLTFPLTLEPGQSRTLQLAYDFAVQPPGAQAVAWSGAAAMPALVRLTPVGIGLAVGLLSLAPLSARRARGRRTLLMALALLLVACGGGSDSGVPVSSSCSAPAAADALTASESLTSSQATFTLRPLEAGDIIALRPAGNRDSILDDQPVVPLQVSPVSARTVTVIRP